MFGIPDIEIHAMKVLSISGTPGQGYFIGSATSFNSEGFTHKKAFIMSVLTHGSCYTLAAYSTTTGNAYTPNYLATT